jgi:6-pyruvoyltetrahydropterin/6-carboxytetrahydropterin synthase
MYTVTKKLTFESAHKLNLPYESACNNLHGHSYIAELTIGAEKLNDVGFVIDFTEMKVIQEFLDANWDHATVLASDDPNKDEIIKVANKHYEIEGSNASAEIMCKYIVDVVTRTLDCTHFKFIKVRIHETAKNYAEFIKEL